VFVANFQIMSWDLIFLEEMSKTVKNIRVICLAAEV
jgi:hypothetical protein